VGGSGSCLLRCLPDHATDAAPHLDGRNVEDRVRYLVGRHTQRNQPCQQFCRAAASGRFHFFDGGLRQDALDVAGRKKIQEPAVKLLLYLEVALSSGFVRETTGGEKGDPHGFRQVVEDGLPNGQPGRIAARRLGERRVDAVHVNGHERHVVIRRQEPERNGPVIVEEQLIGGRQPNAFRGQRSGKRACRRRVPGKLVGLDLQPVQEKLRRSTPMLRRAYAEIGRIVQRKVEQVVVRHAD